jgi:hypothetical protein
MCSTYTDVGRYCYSTSKHCYAAGADATALCNIGNAAAAAAATASSRDNLKELRSSYAITAQHKCCCCCCAAQLRSCVTQSMHCATAH